MSAVPHPQRIHSVHVESIDGELCVYDTARQRVHALNHTAAFVWQRCDGRTSAVELAAALAAEASIDDAEAVVRLTLQELAAAHLLSAPLAEVARVSRRDLLARGVAAVVIPAIYSIVAPAPIDAQSRPPSAPTLTSIAPNQGTPGTTVPVTITGTNFVVGATTVTVGGGGVTVAAAGGDLSVTAVIVVSSTSLTANFVIDPSAAAGARTVTVTTAGGTSGGQTFTVGPQVPPPAPTLTSVVPNQGLQDSQVPVTLTGTNFVVGATMVAVSGSGVTVSNVTVGSSTTLTAIFELDPAAAAGSRMVTVTTAGGMSGPQPFTVSLPAPGSPTLTNVAPSQGTRGTTVAVTLTGTNFVVGATTVTAGGSGVTVTNTIVASGTSLTANFVLDPAAATGARTVTVTTAAGTSGPRIFTINLPPPGPPTLASVTPNQGIQGTTVAVTLTGTNFVVGATTVNVAGGGLAVNTVVVGSSTSLTANFVLNPAAAGAQMVAVTTAGGTSGAQTFTITLPVPNAPTLTSVLPNQGMRGTTVAVTLTGTNFVVGATTVAVAGGGVTVNAVVVASATLLTANFVLDPAAVEGPRTVTVSTVGGTSAPRVFTVSLPPPQPPTLTSISPNLGARGSTVAVTLTGTNFVVGGGATTVNVSGSGVTVANVVVGSATSLTASFVIDVVPIGPRDVTVTTAGGTSGAQTFTITLPPNGSRTFNFTGGSQNFTVPAGVVSVTIQATGAKGADGTGTGRGVGGDGGRVTATVSVTPGASLTVRVGGTGILSSGGFNGGGDSTGVGGGGGGGASSVLNGATPLVIAGAGAGGGAGAGAAPAVVAGRGGGCNGLSGDPGQGTTTGGGGGGGGTQSAGGAGGAKGSLTGTDGTAGVANLGGNGGSAPAGVLGGGGGGGGYFGGGGGGGGDAGVSGGAGGGGGSSFTALGATGVVHEGRVGFGLGLVTITW